MGSDSNDFRHPGLEQLDDKTASPASISDKDYSVVCKTCGADSDVTLDILNARAEIALRNHALALSIFTLQSLIASYVWFSYMGKPLILPDTIWAIIGSLIAAPWIGTGGAKIAKMLRERR